MARPPGTSGASHGGQRAVAGASWRLPPYTVRRERLLQRLDDSMTAPLTLVRTPAGCGKSLLLQSWLAYRPDLAGRCRWVTLRAGSAAQQVRELLAGCAGMPDGTVVVVDELHLLEDDPLLAELVHRVLGAPGLHLVLATRSTVPVPIGLLTAHGRVDVLDEVDLAFDETDLRRLMALLEVEGSDADVAEALAFSAGWAGPLRIMAEHGRTRRVRAIVTALHSYVESEVLDHLSSEDRQLLRDASVLPSLTAASAATVTERRDALARLVHLHALGVPMQWATNDVVALNPVLRHRLQQGLQLEDPSAAQLLNRRAAHWLRQDGRVLEAVRLLLDDRDHGWATVLLAQEFLHLLPQHAGDVLALLDEVPEGAHWRTTVMRGAAWIHNGESVDPTAVLASVEAQLAASATPVSAADEWALTAFRLLVWRSVGYRSSPDLTPARRLALGRPVPVKGPRHVRALAAALRAEHGYWLLHHGHHQEAETVLTEAVTLARLAELWWVAVECLGAAGVACAMSGENERARQLVGQAQQLAAAKEVTGSVLAPARIGAALTLVDDLDLDGARRVLAQHPSASRARPAEAALLAWLESTLLVLEGWEAAGVERALALRRDAVHLTGFQQTMVGMAVFRGLLELGRLDEAAAELEGIDATAPAGHRQLVDLCRGRLLVKQGRPRAAVELLTPYLEDRATSAREQIGLLSTLVLAAEQAGEGDLGGKVQSQLDAVCDRVGVAHDRSRQSLLTARLRFRGSDLSPSELKVLRRLDSERTLSQLADDLFISTNTIKTHLRNIYRKLQVPGRRQAVERARLLNLV